MQQTQGSIVIVVYPLLALMKDQVDSFKKGISSAYVSSEQEKQCVEMKEKVKESISWCI